MWEAAALRVSDLSHHNVNKGDVVHNTEVRINTRELTITVNELRIAA